MKRMLLLFLALLPLLCGCGAPPAEETAPAVRLTALQYELENQAIDFSELWFYRQLEEKTGVHVDFEPVRDDDWEMRLQLMFASGRCTDLVLRGSLDTEEYGVSKQLLLPLDEYLAEDMPIYWGRLQGSGVEDALRASDGRRYAIGFLLSQDVSVNGHFFINRTWLDRLRLPVPATVAELTDTLRAFRDRDPNGNGLRDEIPYQATLDDCNTGLYNVFSAWGIPMNEDFVYLSASEEVLFAPLQPGFREAAEWLHLLCDERLLDVESLTQGSSLWSAKVNQNTAGYFSYWRLSNTALKENIASQFCCMLPVHAEGASACLTRIMDTVEFGAALTVQNHDVHASLRWLDAQMDTETMLVSQNGPVGDLLTLREDGRYEVARVPADNELYQIVPVICGQFFAPRAYYRSVYVAAPHRVEKTNYCQWYEEAGVLEPFSEKLLTVEAPRTGQEAARLARLKKALKSLVDGFLVDAAVNGVTDERWAAFQAGLLAAGAEEYTALYQAVYDRHRGESGEVSP